MLKAVLMVSALGLAALTLSPSPGFAAVKPQLSQATTSLVTPVGRRHHHHHHRHFHHRHHHHHHGHFHRRGFVIGAPLFSYGYGYDEGCAWLRHRAIVTGSPYWWRRYRWCRGW